MCSFVSQGSSEPTSVCGEDEASPAFSLSSAVVWERVQGFPLHMVTFRKRTTVLGKVTVFACGLLTTYLRCGPQSLVVSPSQSQLFLSVILVLFASPVSTSVSCKWLNLGRD